MCTALMVGRRARRHIGPADRKAPLRVGTPEQHMGAACAAPLPPPKCVPLAPIDLLGRTGLARLHLRVRFGVTDEVRTLSVGLIGPVWIYDGR